MIADSQLEVKNWFDQTYSKKGFKYLRPVSAYHIFATLLKPKPGSKHLDVACGPGLMLKALEKYDVQTYGIDLSTEAIKQCKSFCPNALVQEGNAENLPFNDDTFDSITCIGSLERMLHREKALAEQFRVAKSGAKVCFMVRNAENFTWKYLLKPMNLYNKKGHQDALNLENWSALFLKTGFQIESVYPDHWPYYKFIKAFFPWAKIDPGKIRKFPFNLNLAYEFIFYLRKP
ncbi:class I SAM-dependent methyltransferase [Flexithrix dorotheae]|uniref:class I SAM-dependent methyltransferase n=1 Tax=Flexithrix dorotheae TaxID=70993 RepID=UPI00036CA552|nr:class I SAM-dependent methyltransferase [Flexithrix dorotheae]